MKKLKTLFWFFEPWILICCVVLWLWLSHTNLLIQKNQLVNKIALFSLLAPYSIIIFKHIADFYRFHILDYSPKGRQARRLASLTPDKLRALYPPIPKGYKSQNLDGIILGKDRKEYIRIPFSRNLMHGLIIGSPGSGKSSGPYLCTLINNYMKPSPDTFFVIDIKGELSSKSVPIKNNQKVKVMNPIAQDSIGWDVYYGITQNSDDDDVLETLDRISRALIVDENPRNGFFVNQARKIFKGCLLYYYRKQVWIDDSGKHYGFVDAVNEVNSRDVTEHIQTILSDDSICLEHWKIKALLAGFVTSESEALNGVKLQLQENLDVFTSDDIVRFLKTSHQKACPLDLNNGISIFLAIPEDRLEQMQTVFRMIVFQTLSEMEKRPEGLNRVTMLIDEFPRLGKVEKIADALATLRSRNVSIWLAIQDVSQLDRIYGKETARSIVNLCEITCVLSCRDVETGKMLSEWSGKYRETKVNSNRNSISHIQSGVETVGNELRPIVELSDLMTLRESREVMLWLQGHYCRVKRLGYFEDPVLSKRSLEVQKRNQMKFEDCEKPILFFDEGTLTGEEMRNIDNDVDE